MFRLLSPSRPLRSSFTAALPRNITARGWGPRRTFSDASTSDVRAKLMAELKDAMKTKNTVKSTTIRSVLSEVYAADKAASGTAPPSAVIGILRKAATRRTDAAVEFTKASRPDLAEKEQQEAAILNAFLPPLLPVADIDRVLRELVAAPPLSDALAKGGPPQKVLGQVFKAFYGQVDKSSVDPDLVRQRAQALLDGIKA
ncbi:Yqey-like protein-domain-containing protein [Daedaleopsis nitida]|nr:Yqey-like protein-domain-containing protein [Daedaleopsis nitida]